LETLVDQYNKVYTDTIEELSSRLSEVLPTWRTAYTPRTLREHLTAISSQWLSNADRLKDIEGLIQSHRKHHETLHQNLLDTRSRLTERSTRKSGAADHLAALRQQRSCLFAGKPVDEILLGFTEKEKQLDQRLKTASESVQAAVSTQNNLTGIISQLKQDIDRIDKLHKQRHTEIESWMSMREPPLDWSTLTHLLSHDASWLQRERQSLNALRKQETEFKATLDERQHSLTRHRQAVIQPEADETRDMLTTRQSELETAITSYEKQKTTIEIALHNHHKGIEEIKHLERDLTTKEQSLENWQKLNALLGSASGYKFKEIAQCYTLEALLHFANHHLRDLSPRYKLQRIADSLALQVIDLDMLNETRTVHSLSGGESFLLSLALALGLSSLSSSRMKIESLFIDEGFGALDAETLRTAMDALERLQTQGRKIGVISHVTEMTERIPTRICVTKTSNGRSVVSIKKT
jgi:exonuclease SbcC